MEMILEAHGSFVGRHFWPEGASQGYPELEKLHEHTFNVRILLRVLKAREVEFIAFGRKWALWLSQRLEEHLAWSCEEMAEDLLQALRGLPSVPEVLAVRVQEDEGSAAVACTSVGLAGLIVGGLRAMTVLSLRS